MVEAGNLLQESNRLYAAINQYNNIMVPQAEQLLVAYGINENNISISHLTDEQKLALDKTLLPFNTAITKEVVERSFERNLKSFGINTYEEACQKVELYFTGQAKVIILNNFSGIKSILDLIDSLIGTLVATSTLEAKLGTLVQTKNRIKLITPQMDKV